MKVIHHAIDFDAATTRSASNSRPDAVEPIDDASGIYNFNWSYYLESLRPLCTTGSDKPFDPK